MGEAAWIEGADVDGSWGEVLLWWTRLDVSRDKRCKCIKPRSLLPLPGDEGEAGGAVVEGVRGGKRPGAGGVGCVNIYYGYTWVSSRKR